MTKDFIMGEIRRYIKQNGVNGYYIYLETPIELSNGTIINEVRNSSNTLGIEALEQYTNRVINKFVKGDLQKIYDNI